MRELRKLGGLLLAAFTGVLAQAQPPFVRPESVVNAASYITPGLPSYGIAQGGMFIVKGQRLGPRGLLIANSFPLGITLGGVQMRLTVNGTTMATYMIYVVGDNNRRDVRGQYDQVAAIVPSNMPAGSGTLTS